MRPLSGEGSCTSGRRVLYLAGPAVNHESRMRFVEVVDTYILDDGFRHLELDDVVELATAIASQADGHPMTPGLCDGLGVPEGSTFARGARRLLRLVEDERHRLRSRDVVISAVAAARPRGDALRLAAWAIDRKAAELNHRLATIRAGQEVKRLAAYRAIRASVRQALDEGVAQEDLVIELASLMGMGVDATAEDKAVLRAAIDDEVLLRPLPLRCDPSWLCEEVRSCPTLAEV